MAGCEIRLREYVMEPFVCISSIHLHRGYNYFSDSDRVDVCACASTRALTLYILLKFDSVAGYTRPVS